ncbi:MAG: hypothetical protein HXY34_07035 [Candidatus Thorarchaeota archaeon]|nr:hypothetical protein [Candidatus Thorarchaeota archaeon]
MTVRMLHVTRRGLMVCTMLFMLSLWCLGFSTAAAQPTEEWFGDSHIQIYIGLDGRSITTATATDPLVVDLETPTALLLKVNTTGSQAIYNLTGSIGFYYQGIKVFAISVQQAVVQYIPAPLSLPPVATDIDFGAIFSSNFSGYSIDLATGIYQASVDFQYFLEGDLVHPQTVGTGFYVTLPPKSFIDVVTSVAGIAVTAATAGAVVGTAGSIKALLDGLATAHKVRSIQKKAGEIRSLPNLTVIGALPALFSVLSAMALMGKKKKKGTATVAEPESKDGVSEYVLRQRVREIAPEAWQGDKCPKCRKNWDRKKDMCGKCGLDHEDAKREYGEYLSSRVPRAIKVLGKKKSLSIKKLSKKAKMSQYSAGVIGAAMVDTGFTEVTKIDTPLRSFVTNIGGLAFLILTWQQLLGGAASQFQTTLTVVGGGMSVAVIIALYFARRTQIKRLKADLEAGRKLMPTMREREEQAAGTAPSTDSHGRTDSTGPEETSVPTSGESSEAESAGTSEDESGDV